LSTTDEILEVFNEDIERKSKIVREKLLSRLLKKRGFIQPGDLEEIPENIGSVPDNKSGGTK